MPARAACRQAALEELGSVDAKLETGRERARQTCSVLDRAVVRAPVSGKPAEVMIQTEARIFAQ